MGSLSHKVDKYDKYNPDEETIEAWLKDFEIRLLCHNIWEADLKRNWCMSLVGEAGNSIIEKLPQSAVWTEIKKELCSVLGEGDPKKRAFEVLSRYKPKGKGLGEMATDIMAKAALATNDAGLQTQLGSRRFFRLYPETLAVSCVVGISTRLRKPSTRDASFSQSKRRKTVVVGRSSRLKQTLHHLWRSPSRTFNRL